MLVSREPLHSTQPQSNTCFYKKNLQIKNLNKAQILQKLQLFFGCIYLENANQTVISLLPKHYCVVQNQQHVFFSRQFDFQYQIDSTVQSLLQFVQFSTTPHKNHQNLSLGFQGGYMGFIDYNFAANQHIRTQPQSQPNLYLGCYESFLKQEDGQWYFYSLEENADIFYQLILKQFEDPSHTEKHQTTFKLTEKCQATWEKSDYQHAFQNVQDYIVAGDCYQINLTQEFKAKANGQLLDTAHDFWHLTQAPYSGYLKLNDFELLSCSPELFIDFEENRKLVTKPIKGTMPRFDNPEQDEQSKRTLAQSKKDQAENVMIVDLLRNDLSVFAETGSVKTPKLFNIESFNQVHHMVSEIEATLKPEVNPFEVLLHSLPGGSITGAPKIRAMEIIEELEAAPRGAYCGSLGYFNFDGTGSWNILIRSIQKYQEDVSLWAGGGITISSDCDAEYQECFDKVEAMLNLLNTWYKAE